MKTHATQRNRAINMDVWRPAAESEKKKQGERERENNEGKSTHRCSFKFNGGRKPRGAYMHSPRRRTYASMNRITAKPHTNACTLLYLSSIETARNVYTRHERAHSLLSVLLFTS